MGEEKKTSVWPQVERLSRRIKPRLSEHSREITDLADGRSAYIEALGVDKNRAKSLKSTDKIELLLRRRGAQEICYHGDAARQVSFCRTYPRK